MPMILMSSRRNYKMTKGKDFMRRNIQLPNEYYRNAEDYYKNFYPPDFWESSKQQLQAEKLKNAFEDFKKTKPNAYALLCELFGKSAFKVFKHFDIDKLSEGKCLELLKFLTPVDDSSEESRALQAITTPSLDEIA